MANEAQAGGSGRASTVESKIGLVVRLKQWKSAMRLGAVADALQICRAFPYTAMSVPVFDDGFQSWDIHAYCGKCSTTTIVGVKQQGNAVLLWSAGLQTGIMVRRHFADASAADML